MRNGGLFNESHLDPNLEVVNSLCEGQRLGKKNQTDAGKSIVVILGLMVGKKQICTLRLSFVAGLSKLTVTPRKDL